MLEQHDKSVDQGLTYNRSQRGSCSAVHETLTQNQVVCKSLSTRFSTNMRCERREGRRLPSRPSSFTKASTHWSEWLPLISGVAYIFILEPFRPQTHLGHCLRPIFLFGFQFKGLDFIFYCAIFKFNYL